MKQKVIVYLLLLAFILYRVLIISLAGCIVVFTITSYTQIFKIFSKTPLYDIPVWFALYGCFSLATMVKYSIYDPIFKSKEVKMTTFGLGFMFLIAFINYVVAYQLISPEHWFENKSLWGTIFKTITMSMKQ